jgi:hypothetical protein
MSAETDVLVFDMSSQSSGDPNIFVRRDFLSILDNQNQSYSGNQSIIDTSQIANSNKYINYREAFLSIPLLITATGTSIVVNSDDPQTKCPDFAFALKNWLGQIIHSITVDFNGTTIIQQTPYQSLYNCFRLITTLSYNDLLTQSSSIGFWKDNALTFTWEATLGTQNNYNLGQTSGVLIGNSISSYQTDVANEGLINRQLAFAYDPLNSTYNTLLSRSNATQSYKSLIFNNSITGNTLVWQQAIMGTIYLRHLHQFFDKVCLLKGVLLRITLNLNQSSVSFTATQTLADGVSSVAFSNVIVTSPLGGVSPLMIANGAASQGSSNLPTGNYTLSLAVGKNCLNTQQAVITGVTTSPLSPSITLNVPAYVFNPVFENSYLSSPIKKVVYTDIYQYQVPSIGANNVYNQLITNGIANIKRVLILPYFAKAGTLLNCSPIQSPFDTAGATTSPLCIQGNFQVQISGENMLYNQYQYTYNEWLQQLYGCLSVNGGLTDGLSSGLISQVDFETLYNYYVVDCSRMLSVEELVPKSVQILGQNYSSQAIQLYVFVEYGVEISLDILSGARV